MSTSKRQEEKQNSFLKSKILNNHFPTFASLACKYSLWRQTDTEIRNKRSAVCSPHKKTQLGFYPFFIWFHTTLKNIGFFSFLKISKSSFGKQMQDIIYIFYFFFQMSTIRLLANKLPCIAKIMSDKLVTNISSSRQKKQAFESIQNKEFL